jgi:DNA-binding MarR family transcriptional regulator
MTKLQTDEELKHSLLGVMAKTWILGRVIIEHTKAGTTPTLGNDLSEREELALRLIELFPKLVTEKTLCRTFGLSFSRAGQLVKRLIKLHLLEEKAGRGKPLALTDQGKQKAREVELKRGESFDYVCAGMNREKLDQLYELMDKMCRASQAAVNKKLFDIVCFEEKP